MLFENAICKSEGALFPNGASRYSLESSSQSIFSNEYIHSRTMIVSLRQSHSCAVAYSPYGRDERLTIALSSLVILFQSYYDVSLLAPCLSIPVRSEERRVGKECRSR